MSETITVCPNCDNSSIVLDNQSSLRKGGQSYRCTACGERFEQPNERKPEGHTNSVKGMAKKLYDAKPDEVGE